MYSKTDKDEVGSRIVSIRYIPPSGLQGLLARNKRIMAAVFSLTMLTAICLFNIHEDHWVNRPGESTGLVPVKVLLSYPEKYEGRLVLISGTVRELYTSSRVLSLKSLDSDILVYVKEEGTVNVGDDITVYGSVLLISKGYVDALWVQIHRYPRMWLHLSAGGALFLVYYLLSGDEETCERGKIDRRREKLLCQTG